MCFPFYHVPQMPYPCKYHVFPMFLYAVEQLGAYYCMDIHFWYSGVYHMEQRYYAVFSRNKCRM